MRVRRSKLDHKPLFKVANSKSSLQHAHYSSVRQGLWNQMRPSKIVAVNVYFWQSITILVEFTSKYVNCIENTWVYFCVGTYLLLRYMIYNLWPFDLTSLLCVTPRVVDASSHSTNWLIFDIYIKLLFFRIMWGNEIKGLNSDAKY